MKILKVSMLFLRVSSRLIGCSSKPFTGRHVAFRLGSRLSAVASVSSLNGNQHNLLKIRGGQQNTRPNDAVGNDITNKPSSGNGQLNSELINSVSTNKDIPLEPPLSDPPLTTSSQPNSTSISPKNSKLSNFQERAPPAIIMLVLTFVILRFLGENGLIGLTLAMQVAMYSESCSVVEDYHVKNGSNSGGDLIVSFPLQKWWWFATAVALTSGRSFLTQITSLTSDQMNFITFGMAAIGLVWAVIQLAMIFPDPSVEAESIFRNYLGKVACCHFSLVFLVGQSSFWIQTVQEFGLAWVLFPAFLVIVNDTMAYVFGVLFGKHKLLPRLSPKKTVEGFVGAGFSTLGVSVPLLRRMIGKDGALHLSRHAIILALYVSIVSPFGGFLASAVKRAHGAKDFGALIPGHGGIVDRFDCQVVTAPFVYLYLKNYLDKSVQ